MRGKVPRIWQKIQVNRITPAYAGKRPIASAHSLLPKDHPRICGEKFLPSFIHSWDKGSPPHMRGKEFWDIEKVRFVGITPAYAGKSSQGPVLFSPMKDHPRICGEKQLGQPECPQMAGSPPHMRGKAFQTRSFTDRLRITPAYAGKRLKRSRSTVPPVAIVPLFPSVCNKPVVSDGSPAGRDAPLFLPAENAVPASPAYNLRSL